MRIAKGNTKGENELFVSDISRICKINKQTIYYYERLGLIKPKRRTPSGYRVFSPETCERIEFIKKAQKLKIRLSEIRQILKVVDSGKKPCRHVLDLIDVKIQRAQKILKDIQDYISELKKLKRKWKKMDISRCRRKYCSIIEEIK
ncbi:Mercuric resistance operon regulatory protein [bacterium HR19]|nr:Mercuric resistance operon regulatory protein [bacterium HR19]